MTVQQQQRYESSSLRNFGLFKFRNGKTPRSDGSLSSDIHYPYFGGMELNDLKHHIGIKANDTKYDDELEPWLAKVKVHAKKNEIKTVYARHGKTAPKAESISATAEEAISKVKTKQIGGWVDQTVAKAQSAGADTEFPHAKGHNINVDGPGQSQSKPEKKINPKKAARQAAVEASGTAPAKRVNADEQRAQSMAAKAKRQPRIMVKH